MSDDGQAIGKISYSHDKVIDVLVANPRVTQRQLAAYFGYTEGWMSRMMSSDAFKLRVANRRTDLVDPLIVASVEERFKFLAVRGLEVLQEKLDQPTELISENLALKALELGARGLGVGGFAGSTVKVDIHNQIDLRAAIEEGNQRRVALRTVEAAPALEVASDEG